MYPTSYVSTMFGIFYLCAQLITLVVPEVVKVNMPYPIVIFSIVNVVCCLIAAKFLRERRRIV